MRSLLERQAKQKTEMHWSDIERLTRAYKEQPHPIILKRLDQHLTRMFKKIVELERRADWPKELKELCIAECRRHIPLNLKRLDMGIINSRPGSPIKSFWLITAMCTVTGVRSKWQRLRRCPDRGYDFSI